MAGGIDWFRWHHGSVNDPKFQLVARRAQASVAEVIAIWACALESASMSEDRGLIGEMDFESLDCALGLEDGKAQRIYTSMVSRDLVDQHGRLVSWNKRQPKRERDDDSAAERKRQQREREAEKTQVTPSHTKSHQETPRGEERRGELKPSNPNGLDVASNAGDLLGDSEDQGNPACPHKQIIALYHEVLPMCPRIRDWTPARAVQLRARWNEDKKRQSLAYWRNLFEYISTCGFLVGKTDKPFYADLEWITKSKNFAKIREGRYESREAA